MSSNAKRLYQITDTQNPSKAVNNWYFAAKQDAKAARRELNGDEESGSLRYVVSPGPDHKSYHHVRQGK